jgi:hypothetical protein
MYQQHDPCQVSIPDRWNCNGTACISLAVCNRIPVSAKTSGKDIVRVLIMGPNTGKRQALAADREEHQNYT